jgi:photosystem II stability/assembly factor-like uncharacterized protein
MRHFLPPGQWLPLFLFISGVITLSPSSNHSIKGRIESKGGLDSGEGNRKDELGPNELFYYDRNYPDYKLHYDTYRRKLKASIAYDNHASVSKRGLDFPWTLQGPGNIGGRVNTIAVYPGNSSIMFIGYSQGGIYRTEDGGQHWTAVFDDQESLSISDIEFDPQQPDHMWATTGDVNISGYYFVGAGVFESKDGGRTWQYKGLKDAGILSKIAIDNIPKYLYVGSMGFPAQKGMERGIYRSTNNGMTWEKTLTIDDSTGIIDIVPDRTKSGRVFATAWTRIRSNAVGTTMGPGTGFYRSDDFGATWVNVHNGLPEGMHSRTSVEITNAGTLFVSYVGTPEDGYCAGYPEALINIYKSIDSGQTWDTIPTAPIFNLPCDALGGFGWYFEAIKVNPQDPDDIYILGVDLYRTRDGGLYWTAGAPPWWTYEVHADKHVVTFANGEVFLGTDGGAYRADVNTTDVWQDMENIPSTQFYRTSWNPHTPELYYGGAQDNGTAGGNEATFNEWTRILGGDGFQPLFDVDEPDWSYALTQNGDIWFSDNGGADYQHLIEGLDGTRYWDMPFVISTHDPKILFCASDRVYKINMKDSLREWSPISPDLTKGIFLLGNRYPAVTALAQSPLDELRMYAGTQDGLIWTSADGGNNWTNITDGTSGVFVTSIVCSTINPLGVIATHSGYRDNDNEPYIYRSGDAGLTWEPIGTDIPMMGVNNIFIMPASEDTLLIAGTDGGVYVSFNSGDQWDRVGSNMPHFPVYDIDYDPVGNKIIAATFARGIMTFPMDELELETAVKPALSSGVERLSVWPTISSGTFNLQWKSVLSSGLPIEYSLIDRSGSVLERRTIFIREGQQIVLQHEYLPGLYYLQILTGGRLTIAPIILE